MEGFWSFTNDLFVILHGALFFQKKFDAYFKCV